MSEGSYFSTAKAANIAPPIASLCVTSLAFALALTLLATLTLGSPLVSLIVFAVVVGLVGHGIRQAYSHEVLGLCNVVTLARAAMGAFLAGAVFATSDNSWLVFVVAVFAFSLDGVDGWLARRSGLISEFGARFDMETDAFMGAILATWLFASGKTGPEILVLGYMRYAFCAAALFLLALQADLPESFRRKAICVVQISALITLIFPLTPSAAVLPVSFVASILLSWSFAVDIKWLLRRAE